MINWESWQCPTDDVPELQTIRFGERTKSEWIVYPVAETSFSYLWYSSELSRDLFCFCDNYGCMVRVRSSTLSEEQLEKSTRNLLGNFRIGRAHFIGESGLLRKWGEPWRATVAIGPTGYGVWDARPQDDMLESEHHKALFRLCAETFLPDFIARPALDVAQQLEKALMDASSEASFARSWAYKTERQRKQALWNWSPPARKRKRAELEEWFECCLLNDDSLWETGDAWSLSVSNISRIILYGKGGEHMPSEPLRKCLELVWYHFAPLNTEVLKHECASKWLEWEEAIEPFRVEVSQPSAHERLEAKLRWQEWLASAVKANE